MAFTKSATSCVQALQDALGDEEKMRQLKDDMAGDVEEETEGGDDG